MTEIKPEILFLKQEDVVAAGLLDMKKVMEVTEKTFKMIAEKQIINPPKTMLGMPNMENWTSFCMSMPSYIGGDVDIAGFKWASEAVYNADKPGMPYGIDVVMLTDPKTVYPKAIMDGTLITAMRTSAATGVAAKYLCSQKAKKAAMIGAGVIGRTMVMAVMEAVPGLQELHLVDLNFEKAEGIAKEYEGKYNVIPGTSAEEACQDADLIITMTTSRKPVVKKEWVKKNATVLQVSINEIEEEILLNADKKVVDNWVQLSHASGGLINRLESEGKISEDMVSTLPQLCAGLAPGRESEDELCVCGTYGIGSIDVAVAHMIYENAKKMGLGQKLLLWDNPLWV